MRKPQLKGGNIMSVQNQRIVTIHKDNVQKTPFLSININLMRKVYNDLKNAYSFFIYLYLCSNTDGFNLEFSPKAIENEYGFAQSTARDHFKKLVEKGYLVQKHSKSNIYDFYAEPEHLKTIDSAPLNTFDFGE